MVFVWFFSVVTCKRSSLISAAEINVSESDLGGTLTSQLDLGLVAPKSRHSCEFMIVNSSSQPLQVEGFSVSCSCMKPQLAWSVLHPNEEAPLIVGFIAGSQSKLQQGFVELKLADATVVRVVLNADIRSQFVPTVSRLHFRLKPDETTQSQELVIQVFHTDSIPYARLVPQFTVVRPPERKSG